MDRWLESIERMWYFKSVLKIAGTSPDYRLWGNRSQVHRKYLGIAVGLMGLGSGGAVDLLIGVGS